MASSPAKTGTSTPGAGLRTAALELGRILGAMGRPDLAERAAAAAARANRPSTIVCVVGEFKQGKSSLVNGLLGRDLCPVDDDIATSTITLVRHGDEPGAVVKRRSGDEVISESVPLEDLPEWASERGNPDNVRAVDRVEVATPSSVLKEGLVIVDTPGMGGLGAGHAAATLAFLPYADGLVLTSDASGELTASEIAFLRRATELCPSVMFVQTKIDLYPQWRRIFELNRGHLARHAPDIPAVAVSSLLRLHALERRDRSLNDRSGFPALLETLGDQVITPARDNAAGRSAADLRALVDLVRSGVEAERKLLAGDPQALASGMAELDAAKAELERLRGPAAKWNQVMADRMGDLQTRVLHQFRGGMRVIGRAMDERVELLKTAEQWDEAARDLQTGVAECSAQAVWSVEQGRLALRHEIAALIGLDLVDAEIDTGDAQPRWDLADVSDLWEDKTLGEGGSRGLRAFKGSLTGIRGAQGGLMLLGTLGNLLPKAAASLFVANPVMIGTGLLFGGMQLSEERKRRLAGFRQGARQHVRQFLDDVQFELGNDLGNLMREIQRELRDEFTDQLAERQRAASEAAQRAQAAVAEGTQSHQARKAEVAKTLDLLRKLDLVISGKGEKP